MSRSEMCPRPVHLGILRVFTLFSTNKGEHLQLQKGDSELLEQIESQRSLYEGVRQQEEQLEAEAARVAELESNVDR
uniref:Uncharacterized protein n=1 Tax=Plectus sambesii TaxID=2011161 RepID=A0A914VGC6_9BILA